MVTVTLQIQLVAVSSFLCLENLGNITPLLNVKVYVQSCLWNLKFFCCSDSGRFEVVVENG